MRLRCFGARKSGTKALHGLNMLEGADLKGVVFDIQTYALYDGPGIRTCVFLKGCPLRCAWCHNPESWDRHPQPAHTAERCVGCGACVDACPNQALMLLDSLPVREQARCKVCGACAKACPNKAMEIVGKQMDAEQVVDEAVRDKPFFDHSGGGVTLSGGEPTAQWEFAVEILQKLRERGVHTALETCGLFASERQEALLGLVDLFLFDLKTVDSARHKQCTGVPNELILASFAAIVSRGGSDRIIPRIPLIPTFNDDPESIKAIVRFLETTGYAGQVHLMPYNDLARGKWDKIGQGDKYAQMGSLPEDKLSQIVSMLEEAGFEVLVNR